MSCATVPKIILTLNHASGAGYYAMAGQGFEPHFTFSWPTARIGVMEGDSAVQALFSVELEKYKSAGEPLPKQLQAAIEKTKVDYENWLDARYAAARGHCDAVIDPARHSPNPDDGTRGDPAPQTRRATDPGDIMKLRNPYPRPTAFIRGRHPL